MPDKALQIEIVPGKLKTLRGDRTLPEIADKVGISSQYLHMIENGRRNVPSRVLVKLCKLYGIENIIDLTNQSKKYLPAA